ncbi:MAG: aminopeptidase [Deltaproteobacteria bacterium]|nr:aminopeptidase [Deltaproteobacteria bacterium]
MADARIKKLAGILVNFSVKVKRGDVVAINASTELAKPLVLEVYKAVLLAKAHPIVNIGLEETNAIFYDLAEKSQLKHFPKIKHYEAKNIDCVISIAAPRNKKSLAGTDPKKIAERSKVTSPIRDLIVTKKRWVICNFPTEALAQEGDMSLAEYEDFLYGATNIDWNKAKDMGNRIKKVLDKGKVVRIVGKDTDLTMGITGRKGIPCTGNYNMPDGETFLSPLEDTAEGHIFYEMPAIYQGREVTGIRLTFKKGKVIEASADKNEDFLLTMLDTDKGARYLGELGVAFNYGIKKFTSDILFDEKIGGTVHLALGKSYEEAGGKNKSAIHWDMIKDLRKGGTLFVDGKAVQKNGKFLI